MGENGKMTGLNFQDFFLKSVSELKSLKWNEHFLETLLATENIWNVFICPQRKKNKFPKKSIQLLV